MESSRECEKQGVGVVAGGREEGREEDGARHCMKNKWIQDLERIPKKDLGSIEERSDENINKMEMK